MVVIVASNSSLDNDGLRMVENRNQYQETITQVTDTLIKDRLEFRRLLQTYRLIDLINDESECVEWFRQVMLELAGWVGQRERARVILERFREECDRQREEQERFERAVETGFPNPHIGRRFRRINILPPGFMD